MIEDPEHPDYHFLKRIEAFGYDEGRAQRSEVEIALEDLLCYAKDAKAYNALNETNSALATKEALKHAKQSIERALATLG